jgi:hypothetical protein
VPTWFNAQTLDIRAYGATPDKHDDDDAPAINNALRDSVIQQKPVYIPRGRFNVRQTIEVPAGASLIGASFTNSIIYADESWKPASPTALMRTADAIGKIFLMDFAVNGHEPAPQNGQTANNMYIFHGRTSNMLLRDVQPNRREWWKGQQNKQTVALFSGNAGAAFTTSHSISTRGGWRSESITCSASKAPRTRLQSISPTPKVRRTIPRY